MWIIYHDKLNYEPVVREERRCVRIQLLRAAPGNSEKIRSRLEAWYWIAKVRLNVELDELNQQRMRETRKVVASIGMTLA